MPCLGKSSHGTAAMGLLCKATTTRMPMPRQTSRVLITRAALRCVGSIRQPEKYQRSEPLFLFPAQRFCCYFPRFWRRSLVSVGGGVGDETCLTEMHLKDQRPHNGRWWMRLTHVVAVAFCFVVIVSRAGVVGAGPLSMQCTAPRETQPCQVPVLRSVHQ
ncbi:hypothetical protein B0T19DRAFT_85338 [Cercophora scortea]|uniref:Uncharacterized protein n=1 Tax=Cercophora scortea TaxID=314031 RepID=A0AAE0MGT6_9PEZI|nr:hypothetical protein B0T19DRAFT_85338 [Cercophora scortea]